MRKFVVCLYLALAAILLQSCGKVSQDDIRKEVLAHSKLLVSVKVNVSEASDPIIYIFSKEVSYNQETKTLVIKEGYLGTSRAASISPIYLQEATFKFPFPVTITIEELTTRQKVEVEQN